MWIYGGAAHTEAEQGLSVGSSHFREVNMCEICKRAQEAFRNGDWENEWGKVLDYVQHVAIGHDVTPLLPMESQVDAEDGE